jgi:NTE family protein
MGHQDKRKFIHFMDGGLVDNLGLRGITDVVALSGGAGEFFRNNLYQPPRRFVVIEVNAATASHKNLDLSADEPHVIEVVSALTNMHINKGDAASVQSTKDLINNWSQKISTPEHPTSGYFIQVGLASEEAKMHFVTEKLPQNVVNSIPTSFSLKDHEVDLLIKEGGDLLRTNPVFQQLLSELSDP